MKYIVVADNGQTLIRNLDKEEAVVFAMNMKERYPENNFYVRKINIIKAVLSATRGYFI